MRPWSITALLVGALAAGAGCRQERGPYDPLTVADGGAPHQSRRGVTMLDKTIRDAVHLVAHRAARLPAGQVQARVTMRNVMREDLWVDARLVFFNSFDEPVDVGEWRNVHFRAQDIVLIEGASITSGVDRYNLQLRNLRSASGRELTFPGRVYERGRWRLSAIPK